LFSFVKLTEDETNWQMQLSRSYGTSQINSGAMQISEYKKLCLISTFYLFENTEQL